MNYQFFSKIGNKVGQSAKQQAVAFAKSAGQQLGIETPQKRAVKHQQVEQSSLANLFFTQAHEKDVLLSQSEEEEIKRLDIAKIQRLEEELRQLRMQRQKDITDWQKQQDELMREPDNEAQEQFILPPSPKKGPQLPIPGKKQNKGQPLVVSQKLSKSETGRQAKG
ncbi:MAG: hypothetical protein NZM26_05110 [Patescibacteria group bacterium]|nr:hypothetical protein [Patescibacteria group bacterium]